MLDTLKTYKTSDSGGYFASETSIGLNLHNPTKLLFGMLPKIGHWIGYRCLLVGHSKGMFSQSVNYVRIAVQKRSNLIKLSTCRYYRNRLAMLLGKLGCCYLWLRHLGFEVRHFHWAERIQMTSAEKPITKWVIN